MSAAIEQTVEVRDGQIDSVTFEVLRNAFTNICEEMALTIRRAAYSTNIKTRADFSCAFYDTNLRCVAQSFSQPSHLVTMAMVVPSALTQFGADNVGDGDAIIVNDPHLGASHLNDIIIISSVFVDGVRIGFVSNMAHHVDVGGSSPASLGCNREQFQEGIVIPPTRIASAGKLDENVLNLFLANIRAPRETFGDLRAQLSANFVGVARTADLTARYQPEVITRFVDQLMVYTERWTKAEIRKLPEGAFTAEAFCDDDGFSDEPLRVRMTVAIRDGHITVDPTGTVEQRRSPINCTRPMTKCCLAYVTRCLVDDRIPVNDGFLNCIDVVGPDGLVCTAMRPAAVVGGWEMGQRVVEVIFKALHPALPERIPAAGKGLIVNIGFGGHSPITGEYFCYMETIAGGNGARPGKDGPDAVQTNLHNTENAPIEEVELNYPIRVTRYELIEDSAGPGTWRGGHGVRRDFAFPYSECQFTVMSDGRKFPPWGYEGGGEARPAHYVFEPDCEARELSSKVTVDVPQHGVVSVQTPGGGGFGEPAKRDIAQIDWDLKNQKLSTTAARQRYPHSVQSDD